MQTLCERPRMVPKTDEREPINISPEAKRQLRHFLMTDAEATGIGYSEFIMQSIAMWREIEAAKGG